MTVVMREGRRVCNSRCHNAKKPKCNCICHGKNHGGNKELSGIDIRIEKIEVEENNKTELVLNL